MSINENRRAMSLAIVVLGAVSILLSGSDVRAQAPARLTLNEAITRGIETSHRLAEVDARREASMAVVQARQASARPLVSFQAGYTRTNHVPETQLTSPTGESFALFNDVPDNYRTRFDLQWPIYTGGRVNALERAARADAEAIGHERAAAQADLKLEITRAYWAVVTATASVRVVEQALAQMDAHLADARNRLQAGYVPQSDVLSSQAQRSRQEMLLIEARNMRESAYADLRRLVGLAPDATIEVDATLAPPPMPANVAAPLVEQARGAREERRAIERRSASAAEMTRAANAGRLPTVNVLGGYNYASPNQLFFPREAVWKTSWDVGFNLNWSVWDGGRVKAEAAQAAATHRALVATLRDFDSTLESEVRQRRLDLESALAAVTSAEDSVRSATEASRVVGDRYAVGLAVNTDALAAQLAVMQAELDRTRAIANALLAAARLERAIGR